ncbi:staphylopine biosynthesis enzyme CntL [Staphylococcus sp. AS1337]|uniref:staphylopine biosynthesis enzyme CntL n=1 Tax=Staphylococcus sp. AS1337 TaxID=3434042 RepID=UPI003F565E17
MNNLEKEISAILHKYLLNFETLYANVLKNSDYIDALEILVDEYSQFILNPVFRRLYEDWEDEAVKEHLTSRLQFISAQCVKQVEVIRAQRLLDGKASTSGYFDNIERCINEEFGQCHITENDKLLLVGSGAYPMTLIQVAKETGASVIGIDIDPMAVDLGQKIIKVLAPNEDIEITEQTVDQLVDIKEVTHIIFSSTIPIKYAILEQLYDLTNENVVVAMRFGDGIKSLFNYPSKEISLGKWRCVDKRIQPNQIFDIALYRKAAIKVGVADV